MSRCHWCRARFHHADAIPSTEFFPLGYCSPIAFVVRLFSVIVNFICSQIVAHFCIAKTGHLRCSLYTNSEICYGSACGKDRSVPFHLKVDTDDGSRCDRPQLFWLKDRVCVSKTHQFSSLGSFLPKFVDLSSRIRDGKVGRNREHVMLMKKALSFTLPVAFQCHDFAGADNDCT